MESDLQSKINEKKPVRIFERVQKPFAIGQRAWFCLFSTLRADFALQSIGLLKKRADIAPIVIESQEVFL